MTSGTQATPAVRQALEGAINYLDANELEEARTPILILFAMPMVVETLAREQEWQITETIRFYHSLSQVLTAIDHEQMLAARIVLVQILGGLREVHS